MLKKKNSAVLVQRWEGKSLRQMRQLRRQTSKKK